MTEMDARQSLLWASHQLIALGLNKGTAGNVSVRWGDGFLITPSGVAVDDLTPASMAMVTMDGAWAGPLKPSSEWRFHRDLYAARSDAQAVVHTHAPFCLALSVHGLGIPAYHYMVAALGGRDVRCAPYATFGTQELSDHLLRAMDGRMGALMAHHGMTVMGPNVPRALALAVELENLAEGYWRARQLGEPPYLSDAEMDRVLEKFKSYGAKAQG